MKNYSNPELALIIPKSPNESEWVFKKLSFFIKKKIKGISEKEMNELRLLIYELFSNTVKYSFADSIVIRCMISGSKLQLWFSGPSLGFEIKPVADKYLNESFRPPYPLELLEEKILIGRSSGVNLYCSLKNSHELIFFSESANGRIVNDEISEHFGLMLITSLSDEVVYKMDSVDDDYFHITKTFAA